MKSKWKLWLLPVLALLAMGLFKGQDALFSSDKPVKTGFQTVRVQEVSQAAKENSLNLSGNVEAMERAVISSKISGRVSGILVQNGDMVSPGQALITLDKEDYANSLTMCKAALQKAQANLTAVQTNYNRYRELFNNGAISQKDFDDVEALLASARSDSDSAAAAVANAEDALSNTTITSPIGGLVANRDINLGQVLTPGVTLMLVEDISAVYVIVKVGQKDRALIRPGQSAAITVDTYPHKQFTGQVAYINPAADVSGRSFEVRIKVNNPGQLLNSGMFAQAAISTGQAEQVLAVPQNAVKSNQGIHYVFIPDGDRVKSQKVETGAVLGQMVEVVAGLKPGQKVVVSNVDKLKDQEKVRFAYGQEE